MPSRLSISTVSAASAIPRAAWPTLCPPGDPFLNADFLAIIERHGAAAREWGWTARHLVASDPHGTVVGLLPLYVKTHSHGDFIYDWSWAAAYRQLGRQYYPKLISCLPHTPVAGPRLLVAEGPAAASIRQALADSAQALAAGLGVSSWHVALPAEADIALLRREGLLISHDVQFHWVDSGCGDFDGYLATFSAARRRKVRAERRRVEDSSLSIETRHGDQIDPAEWAQLHALYADTFARFNNHAVFSAACFADLAAALGRRMVAFIARDRGLPVAVALCFRSDEVLYGRYWGCSGNYHSLHFELCFYQGIAYCLEQGLRRFEPGAGGEHKVSRGFTPTVVHSAHWIADPGMRELLGRHLAQQGEALADYRDEAATHLPFRRDRSSLLR
ncbi:MAG TPA: GNAT family N-acetyltransferase [Accumulibacter sp.]|uniref:GNAT family N-acetyltransferase n=1 Tax=Accumulibacter sp. TaxID=2053492 RepID=UPI002CB38C82|nr:GNAT family N-acetyltransferase [Accumulibacter sp.]HRF73580.1 GNAT family N-acetyltransferase [Accumulibacter sp.]